MFCDLVGSTALSGRIDPEDFREVMRAYQVACVGVVGRYDGHVAKYLGDGMLIYFGYPRAHEDDAERAIRAGLEMVVAISELDPRPDVSLQARIGIATGLVVAGDIIGEGITEAHAISGETPNLAARLQELAEPDTVVISEGTRRLAAGVFKYGDLGRQLLKGLAEPVQMWRVVKERSAESRFEAARADALTPIVGREQEIALLLERWSEAKDGDGQAVLLSGEAGIGKSRIISALRERIDAEPHVRLWYQCSPHHTNSELHPLIVHIERTTRMAPDDDPEAKLTKLETMLGQADVDLKEIVPYFASLLSIPTGNRYPPLDLALQELRERTLAVLADQVLALSKVRPVLVVCEDAQWIDPTTLELLEQTVNRSPSHRLLVVITFRPEFRPPWSGHPHVSSLTLGRLSRRHCETMAHNVTGNKNLPDEVLEEIVTKTDGVPLFVEELTKTVIESGLLEDAHDRYVLRRPLPPLAIPSTLQDSLMARLDRLSTVKEIAQLGAAIGREFPHDLLAEVSPLDEEELAEALEQLVNSELVFRRGTPPHAVYRFKNVLVRDVAYQSLLKSTRQQYHQRIAAALESADAEREPEMIGLHYAEAGLSEKAIPYLYLAGQRAAHRSANAEAAANLNRALELIKLMPDTPERAQLELSARVTLGPALMMLRGIGAPEVDESYTRADRLARSVGSPTERFAAVWAFNV